MHAGRKREALMSQISIYLYFCPDWLNLRKTDLYIWPLCLSNTGCLVVAMFLFGVRVVQIISPLTIKVVFQGKEESKGKVYPEVYYLSNSFSGNVLVCFLELDEHISLCSPLV